MPGTAPKILREATREHRYVLQSRATTDACRGRWRGEMAGTLYVVATPLGNLEDLSPRAAATLTRAAAVAAEDTRHNQTVARSRGLARRTHQLPRALERRRAPPDTESVGHRQGRGARTDAGTPTVSDPGAVLVAAARERDIPVITVPGPTAVAAALSVSGLGADRYLFLGFVPRKGAERGACSSSSR